MSSNEIDRTISLLTTLKVQALLDSGINQKITNKKALASMLSEQNEKISIHGVEGWFKHVDSNYALKRQSLHPNLTTYAVPRKRWAPILQLFGLSHKELMLSDVEFRDMCFARARERESKMGQGLTKDDSVARSIYVIYATEELEKIDTELLWLQNEGYCLFWDTQLSRDLNWSTAANQTIERASCCIVFYSQAMMRSHRCQTELTIASNYHEHVIYISIDEDEAAFNSLNSSERLIAVKTSQHDYRQAIKKHLLQMLPKQTEYILEQTPTKDSELDRPTIAVIPFANLTDLKEVNFAAQGITEDIITLLSRISEFNVISRYASDMFAGMLVDFEQAVEKLNVDFILEGSVRRTKDKLRINCRLSDAKRKQHLWADQFDGTFKNIWDVQDEITTTIVARLQPKLVMRSLDFGARTDNYKAWRHWQLGWYKLFIDSPDTSLKSALSNFYEALKHHPDYALAHAGIANALATGMLWGGIGPEKYESAKYHAETAFRLLPDHPAVLYSMGIIAFISPVSLQVAKDWLEKALAVEPSNPAYIASKGYIIAQLGDAEAGLVYSNKALQLCPGDNRLPFINYMNSNTFIAAGQFENAIQTMLLSDRLKTIDFVWVMVGFAYFMLQDYAQAEQAIKRCISLKPRSLNLFEYSLHNRLWPQYSAEQKNKYLQFCGKHGML